jgi:hypothetical protein
VKNRKFTIRIVLIIALCANNIEIVAARVFSYETLNSFNTQKVDTMARTKRIYHTQQIKNPPIIDGKLNDSCWIHIGEWQSNFTQFSPVYNTKSSHRTNLKILYTDKSILVGIRAYDNMQQISRRLSRRDIYAGDVIGVMFDSYFDHRTAYEFDITSAGQKIDVGVADDQFDLNWNPVWYGKVAYEDSAWTAELEIPFSQLKFGAAPEQIWGLNSWRTIDRLQEEMHWNLVANDGTGIVYTYGELHGLKNIKKTHNIELLPYISGKFATSQKIAHNPFATGSDIVTSGGLDAKINVTNNFTLDATINPDFGQIEADPSEINLSAFETYFEEKRPFFIENKNIFDFSFDNDQLFYSRRIGHKPSLRPQYDTINIPEYTRIGGALKLSGKTSTGLSIGIIESVTLEETAQIHNDNSDFKQIVEPGSNYFVGRFQKEFDKGNTTLGGIVTYTHRNINKEYLNILSNNALTYGIDFTKYWADRKYFFETKIIGSNIYGDKEAIQKLQTSSARYFQRPDIKEVLWDSTRNSLSGYGGTFKVGKWSKGHWRYNEEVIVRSPGLELNDLGYMTISNIVKNNTNISFYEKKNIGIFKTYMFNVLQQNAWDANGSGLYSLFSLTAQSEFMNGWAAQIISQLKYHIVDEWILRGGPSMKTPNLLMQSFTLHTNTSKKLYFNVLGNYNRGLSHNLNYFNITSEISYRPQANLILSIAPNYINNTDELQYIFTPSSPTFGKRYLLGKVDNQSLGITFRADLAITPQLTIQYYGSPFISTGKFSNFKEVVNPLATEYSNRFKLISPTKDNLIYNFDTNQDGITDYRINKPDFNYQQFRNNLVIRWEYKTGSTLYVVWSQDRTSYQSGGIMSFTNSLKKLYDIYPTNVFMIKLSHWLPI